jgi:hypothetical protein
VREDGACRAKRACEKFQKYFHDSPIAVMNIGREATIETISL